ncbi:hypothetical protein [Altererythrobacter lutimaris]|uniref:Uncharacterized protein n=1 Tax=Altererythrobacter lutimaris TaxID=2743979 RepID=A0A850H3J3_9SPHN|nr:hypothetical protein [Altererythrobacter lutimaris]NVE93727.1 hypothetical protein [Altererythrobacter lutimaris]
MELNGWELSSAPDGEENDLHRLYFRKATALTSEAKKSFLTGALRVAHEANGTLMSWINVEDYENN